MALNNALARNIDAVGAPSKKQKFEGNTPLKFFLRPIIEEAMLRKKAMMEAQQAQQMQQTQGMQPMQQTTSNPLQGALMGREEMV